MALRVEAFKLRNQRALGLGEKTAFRAWFIGSARVVRVWTNVLKSRCLSFEGCVMGLPSKSLDGNCCLASADVVALSHRFRGLVQ